MSIDQYRNEIERRQKEIAKLQQDKAREAAKAADENKKALAAAESARRASSISSAQSKLRDVSRHESAFATCQKKIADLESKLAREQGYLNDAHRRLVNAEKQAETKRLTEQKRASDENRRALSSIHGTLHNHERLHRIAFSTLENLKRPPEHATVLFLASNPLDQKQLRLDEEVRLIAEMIRKSDHRDSIRLESRWAVRPFDVLQSINECKPRVIHFSGHGSDNDEIVFQDSAGNAKCVSKEAIVQTIAAGSDEIQLIFFNTCYSKSQAKAVVEHVPAAIGMNTSIGDAAARVFSAQFYSALGFGFSIGKAFKQAKAALMLEGIPEENTPELFIAEGLSEDTIVLVKPAK